MGDHLRAPGASFGSDCDAAARKVNSVDAPVSGGDIGAKNGNLVTMCGGEKNHIENLMPLLKIYSAEV